MFPLRLAQVVSHQPCPSSPPPPSGPGPYRLLIQRAAKRAFDDNRAAQQRFDGRGSGGGGGGGSGGPLKRPDDPPKKATFVCLLGAVAMGPVAQAARSVLLASGAHRRRQHWPADDTFGLSRTSAGCRAAMCAAAALCPARARGAFLSSSGSLTPSLSTGTLGPPQLISAELGLTDCVAVSAPHHATIAQQLYPVVVTAVPPPASASPAGPSAIPGPSTHTPPPGGGGSASAAAAGASPVVSPRGGSGPSGGGGGGVVLLPPGFQQLDLTWRNRTPAMFDGVGESLLACLPSIPAGSLCFFPSRTLLQGMLQRWTQTGLLSRLTAVLGGRDRFFVDSSSSARESQECVARYRVAAELPRAGARGTSGQPLCCALLLAVMRGRSSEGADFADRTCRAVFIVGAFSLPLLRVLSPRFGYVSLRVLTLMSIEPYLSARLQGCLSSR